MPQRAHVVFDESHAQAWTIRPEVARAMQPAHPADSSYALAAAALAGRDFTVAAHADGPLPLADADVLVLAHPSGPRWERVVPDGSPVFADAELDAVEAWVRAGGGLVVLGEEEQAKHATNVGRLLERFGLGVADDLVSDYEHHHAGSPHWVLAVPARGAAARVKGTDLLARVDAACLYRAGTLRVDEDAHVLLRTGPTASTPGAPLAAVTRAGAGRVVVLADSDLFGDDCLDDLDHRALWTDLVTWAAGAAWAAPAEVEPSALAADPAWTTLRDEVDALRLLQRPDGSVDLDEHDADRVGAHVAAVVDPVVALARHVPHQAAHLEAVVDDLRRWAAGGFGVPDFGPSLQRFRLDRWRVDGSEHLVVFPMDKQNGSRDRVFEALVVRVPWPTWLADLERERYDNPKFVPVTLVDHTAGYDSECAVLFPETVATAGPVPNHFGAIFCDRESERFRRVAGEAVEVLRVNLPADAAALLASEALSRDAYELWDLVHDRTHSHGDLPFDPFMIRQRMPYWMYALEELRCDLTAFHEAVGLEAEGVALARHAQTAILFDRLFRFPVTGPRTRNYDGLGGQLLFAWLHGTGRIHWTDNQLTIEWDRVADGVVELRERVEELYRTGITRTKLQHWGAAHDLVADQVAPAAGSRWAAGVRAFAETDDPRPYCDEVLPDEFPLSIFYVSLQRRLADVLRRPARRVAVAA